LPEDRLVPCGPAHNPTKHSSASDIRRIYGLVAQIEAFVTKPTSSTTNGLDEQDAAVELTAPDIM
jgi:hypothetical protein